MIPSRSVHRQLPNIKLSVQVLPIEGGEVYVSLTTGRPNAKSLFTSPLLQDWIQATNIRLRLLQTKTMLGHLMSVAQGDKTVTRRVGLHARTSFRTYFLHSQ